VHTVYSTAYYYASSELRIFCICSPLSSTCLHQNDVKFLNKLQFSGCAARPYAWLIADWIDATDNWPASVRRISRCHIKMSPDEKFAWVITSRSNYVSLLSKYRQPHKKFSHYRIVPLSEKSPLTDNFPVKIERGGFLPVKCRPGDFSGGDPIMAHRPGRENCCGAGVSVSSALTKLIMDPLQPAAIAVSSFETSQLNQVSSFDRWKND